MNPDASALNLPIETELKMVLDPAGLPVFKALPCLADAPRITTHLAARYFDTEDHALRRAGYSLRLRRDEKRTVQTLKGPPATTGALLVRPETETVVTGEEPDVETLRLALPEDLYSAVRGRLAAFFTTEVGRTEWVVRRATGLVSVSLDDGRVQAGDRSESFVEAEFELQDGQIEAVLGLARDAAARVALHVSPLAKSDRGYRLLGDDRSGDRPGETRLAGEQPAAEGIRSIARGLLHTISSERLLVLSSGSAEPVHRLRVALRRLNTLLAFADKAVAEPGLDAVRAAARQAFRRLGAVRDLDILLAAIPFNMPAADTPLATVTADRHAALVRARRILEGRAFGAAMLELLFFCEAAPVLPDGGRTLRAASAHILKRRWRRLLASDPPGTMKRKRRHRFRIDVKTFRYATEFFGELFDEGKAPARRGRIEDSLRTLQDALGRLNDRANTWRLARRHFGAATAASLGLRPAKGSASEDRVIADRAFGDLAARRPFWT